MLCDLRVLCVSGRDGVLISPLVCYELAGFPEVDAQPVDDPRGFVVLPNVSHQHRVVVDAEGRPLRRIAQYYAWLVVIEIPKQHRPEFGHGVVACRLRRGTCKAIPRTVQTP